MKRYRAARLRPSFQIQMIVAAWFFCVGLSLVGPGDAFVSATIWAIAAKIVTENALGAVLLLFALAHGASAWRGWYVANGMLLSISAGLLASFGVTGLISVWRDAGTISGFASFALALAGGCLVAARLVTEER
jgi:hypothetical protein